MGEKSFSNDWTKTTIVILIADYLEFSLFLFFCHENISQLAIRKP